MKWQVRLHGDRKLLEELSRAYQFDNMKIGKDEEGYFLESSKFEDLKSSTDVHAKGEELATQLNGAAMLISGSRRDIQVGGTVHIRKDGLRDITIHLEAGHLELPAPVLGRPILNGVMVEVVPFPGEDLPTLIMLAERDESVARAMEQLQHGGWSWVNLFRLMEIVKADVGDISRLTGIAANDVERFTHSADNPEVAGMDARHGVRKYQPPKRPMTHREAKGFVQRVLKSWVNGKRET